MGIRKESRLTACAMTVAETDAMAILGGVAVAPDTHRQGLGRLAVELFWPSCRNFMLPYSGRNKKIKPFTSPWVLCRLENGRNSIGKEKEKEKGHAISLFQD